MGSSGYWLVRGVESDHIVDRGAGVLSQPAVDCTYYLRGAPVCTNDVHLLISASGKTMTVHDVKGLYTMLRDQPGQRIPVTHIYYDATNSQLNALVYGSTTYRVETTSHAFVVLAVVMLAVGLGLLGWLGTALRARRRLLRGQPVAKNIHGFGELGALARKRHPDEPAAVDGVEVHARGHGHARLVE